MNLSYLFRETFSGIRLWARAHVATCATLVVVLTLIGIFFSLGTSAWQAMHELERKIEVHVYLTHSLTPEQQSSLAPALQHMNGVATVEFISSEDAMKTFVTETNENVERVLGFNPFPAAYRITFHEELTEQPATLDSLIESMRATEGIDDVVYERAFTEVVVRTARILWWCSVIISAILLLASVTLVFNTVNLVAFAKRATIKAMMLVGASQWFIRLPFLTTGIFLGAISGGIAMGFLFALDAATSHIALVHEFIRTPHEWFLLLPVLGASLGLLGSILSTLKLGEK